MTDDRTATDRALARISVGPPYFALEDLNVTGDGVVTATVPHSPTVAPEVGPMEAAQVARHLAILGSCAAALARDDDERNHYLAARADFSRLAHGVVHPGDLLQAEAIATWADKRTVRSMITLRTSSGAELNQLDCEYTVLSPRMFERFNPPVDVVTEAAEESLAFEVVETSSGVVVDCGIIPPSLCSGHFPDYPAAPIAIVMGELCKAAGVGMVRALGRPDDHYRIESGHVEAIGLARAGQRLVLRAAYDRPVPGGHRMEGVAEADGEAIGSVSVDLSAHYGHRAVAPVDSVEPEAVLS